MTWRSVFQSADQSAIKEAQEMGMGKDSTLAFTKTGQGTRLAWSLLSAGTSDLRAARKQKSGFAPPDDPAQPEK